jgi:hypothetical protein
VKTRHANVEAFVREALEDNGHGIPSSQGFIVDDGQQ